MSAWLFTIEQELVQLEPGDTFDIWTEAPWDHAIGAVRRRSDGNPYLPAWEPGEDIVVFHPDSGRCVAVLSVSTDPEWTAGDERIWTCTEIVAFDTDGPRLADIGVPKALQGGRHRLTGSQHAAARWLFDHRTAAA